VTAIFLSSAVWRTIRKAIRTSPVSHVAVAYFGRGGSRRLPLERGSILVVDASELAVKSGQTCPAELLKLYRRGVQIYSREFLHAKVFVAGKTAFVGSANVSSHSENVLMEAMVATSDHRVVAESRRFVLGLRDIPLGPESLSDLAKMYRPPANPAGGTPRNRRGGMPRLKLVSFEDREVTTAEQKDLTRTRRAYGRPTRGHVLLDIAWDRAFPAHRGEAVVLVVKEQVGPPLVYPPGLVVSAEGKRKSASGCVPVLIEHPSTDPITLASFLRKLGGPMSQRLKRRDGPLSQSMAHRIHEIFREVAVR